MTASSRYRVCWSDSLPDRSRSLNIARDSQFAIVSLVWCVVAHQGFGRYELVEELARGAASEYFVVAVSGEHGFRRHILLKRLLDDSQAQAFIDDAKLSAKLSHAKIVQTLELGKLGDVPYVATEYVDGVNLLGLLRELARTRRKLEPVIAVFIAQQILDALDYAHTFVDNGQPLPIVHARLSPSKVLLGEAGEVKLADFGIPRRFDLAHGGQDYGHMSPEQVSELALDARSDIFGVGVLLAEMLTGRKLFAAHNEFDVLLSVRDVRLRRLDERASQIDAELLAIVQRALARRPEERWPSAATFRDALDEWSFAHRAHHVNSQLAVLVASVRDQVDQWRRSGASAAEFEDLPDPTGPVLVPPRAAGTGQPKTIAIPAKLPKASTGIEPLAKPVEDRAAGTERSARGTAQSAPIAKPERPKYHSDPIPPLPKKQPRAASPGMLARVQPAKAQGAIGLGVRDVLPARGPAQTKNQTTQLLSREQVAKARTPAAPDLVKLERAADEGGDFSRTPPMRVLFHLMRTRATGLLTIARDNVRKDIYVSEGQLASVWSDDKADLFGNFLVAHQVISEGELAMALATMSYYGGKIGDTLVGLGLLSRVEVFRQLTRHARTKVIDLCTWSSGRYAWYANKEDPHEAFPLEAESFTLLGEAALALPPATIDAWLAKHRGDRLVLVRTHRVPADVFGVRYASNVFDTIDGVRAVGEIVERQADRAHAARVVYLFVACELVRTA